MRRVEGILVAAGLVAAALWAPGAVAALTWQSWTPSGNGVCATGYNCYGNARTASAGGITTTVTAWSFTGDSGGTNNAVQNAYLSDWGGGLGVNNRDQTNGDTGEASTSGGNHAVDNQNRSDYVLMNFGASLVNLTSINFGWVTSDADITVLAFTGSGTPTPAGTRSNMTSQGWTVVGNYGGTSASTSMGLTNQSVYASYWLIGAFDPNVGGATYNSPGTGIYDAFKIASVTGDTRQVPEPGAFLLFGTALVAGAVFRRRKSA